MAKEKRTLKWITGTALLAAFAVVFAVGYFAGDVMQPVVEVKAESHLGGSQRTDEAAAKFYTCAMHPQIRQPGPGRCPICAMELVPVTVDDAGGQRTFATTEASEALMDIETAVVEKRFPKRAVRMVGRVSYDERRLGYITARVGGRLDRLYVDFTGVEVREGDPLVYMYSPEIFAAQEELIQAVAAARELEKSDVAILKETAARTVESAREKLRLWGLDAAQIAEIETEGGSSDHITILAPLSGTVIHKNAQQGVYVKTGDRIYAIADLSVVWVTLDAYENDLEWLSVGDTVTFTVEAFPGSPFTGEVAFIDPLVDARTRTVKVRIDAANPDGRLKPDMFVRAEVKASLVEGDSDGVLVIPSSAPLITGTRAVVYVAVPDAQRPTFEGRQVVLGPRAGDYYVVRSGLSEGERVVTNGAFKIDSALQIQAKPSMMSEEGSAGAGAHAHHGGSDSGASAVGRPGAIDVPMAFMRQVSDLEKAAANVADAVSSGDLDAASKAFGAFADVLASVDMSLLTGHAHMMWTELSMLLTNDAVEGRAAVGIDEARRVAALLNAHMTRVADQFGSSGAHSMHAMSETGVKVSAPPAFQKQLGVVYGAYLIVGEALSRDDYEQALKGCSAVQTALEAVDMALLDTQAHMVYMAQLALLDDAARKAASAADLAAVRTHFASLSKALEEALSAFGVAAEAGTVHIVHCPMAFENAGAIWLQDSTEVMNPYFGSAMLKCGEVVRQIEPPMPVAQEGHRHE